MPSPSEMRQAARVAIIEIHKSWQFRERRLGWGTFKEFADLYNTAMVDVPLWVREVYPGINAGTLGAWYRAIDNVGVDGLRPAYGNRQGQGILDTDGQLRQAVAGIRDRNPNLSAAKILAQLETAFPHKKLPSKRTLQRFLGCT